MEEVRQVCAKLKIPTQGMRAECLLRIQHKMEERNNYKKVFTKFVGSSGKPKFVHLVSKID
jgi:hypothetical protein